MTRMLPIIGSASLLFLGLNTAWAQVVVPTNPTVLPVPVLPAQVRPVLPAQALPAQPTVLPVRAPQPQVRLYRLRNAQALYVADELATVLTRPDVRIAGDPRTNSVIVSSPPDLQNTVASLITRLDAVQAPAATGPTAAAGGGLTAGSQAGAVLNTLDQLLSTKGNLPQGSEIAVMRISPAAARALGAVMQPQQPTETQVVQQPPVLPTQPAQPPQLGQQPLEYQAFKPPLDGTSIAASGNPGGQIRTFTVSHDEVAALAQALRSLSAHGANPNEVVAVPIEGRTSSAVPSPPHTPSPPATSALPGNTSR
jgi:hypothetical protein